MLDYTSEAVLGFQEARGDIKSLIYEIRQYIISDMLTRRQREGCKSNTIGNINLVWLEIQAIGFL